MQNNIPQEFESVVKTAQRISASRNYQPTELYKAIVAIEKLSTRAYVKDHSTLCRMFAKAIECYKTALGVLGDPVHYKASETQQPVFTAKQILEEAIMQFANVPEVTPSNIKSDIVQMGDFNRQTKHAKQARILASQYANTGWNNPNQDVHREVVYLSKFNAPAFENQSGTAVIASRPADYGNGWEIWITGFDEPYTIFIVGRVNNPFSSYEDAYDFAKRRYPHFALYGNQLSFAQTVLSKEGYFKAQSANKSLELIVSQILNALIRDPQQAMYIYYRIFEFLNWLNMHAAFNDMLTQHIQAGLPYLKPWALKLELRLRALKKKVQGENSETEKAVDEQIAALDKLNGQRYETVEENLEANKKLKNISDSLKEMSSQLTSSIPRFNFFSKLKDRFARKVDDESIESLVAPILGPSNIVPYPKGDIYAKSIYAMKAEIASDAYTILNSLMEVGKKLFKFLTGEEVLYNVEYATELLNQFLAMKEMGFEIGLPHFTGEEESRYRQQLKTGLDMEKSLQSYEGSAVPDYLVRNLEYYLEQEINQTRQYLSALAPKTKQAVSVSSLVPPEILTGFAGGMRYIISGLRWLGEKVVAGLKKIKIKHIRAILELLLKGASLVFGIASDISLRLAGLIAPNKTSFINTYAVNRILNMTSQMNPEAEIGEETLAIIKQLIQLRQKPVIRQYQDNPQAYLQALGLAYLKQNGLIDKAVADGTQQRLYNIPVDSNDSALPFN